MIRKKLIQHVLYQLFMQKEASAKLNHIKNSVDHIKMVINHIKKMMNHIKMIVNHIKKE
jgi:hypothetical protein